MTMHCKVPTISDQDKTIFSTTDLIEFLRETAPSAETDKSWHATTTTDLTAIITDRPSQRVRLRRSPRLANLIATTTPVPRVSGRATTETNLTSPRVVQGTQYVHQRTTRNNTNFHRHQYHLQFLHQQPAMQYTRQPTTQNSYPRKHSAN